MFTNQHVLLHSDEAWWYDAHTVDEDRQPVCLLEQRLQFRMQDGKPYEVLRHTETGHILLLLLASEPYTAYEFTDANTSLWDVLAFMGYTGDPDVGLQMIDGNAVDDLSSFIHLALAVPIAALPVCQLCILY